MPGRIVIITGAKGGLGTSVTSRFLDASDTVVGASRSIKSSDFPRENFVAVPTDFSDRESVSRLAGSTIERFGRIDALVHVVGGFAGGAPIHETDEQTWKQMLDQNLNAAFHVIGAVVPHMRKAKFGRIVMVGSKAADQPHAKLGAYVISKTALVTLVKTVALENTDAGITANLVLPGTMDTAANRAAMPSADRSKWVHPSDVANVIYWLSTDAASQVNGAAIPVSGSDL
jgi:NAD(P)-dependent dehydrogenase (short-subunit alcohol dehydrogenase family)